MNKEQIDKLNEFQESGRFHPLTCCSYDGCDRSKNDWGVLVATEEKWVCPCGRYSQEYGSELNMINIQDNSKSTF